MDFNREILKLKKLKERINDRNSKEENLQLISDYLRIATFLQKLNVINKDNEIFELAEFSNIDDYIDVTSREKLDYFLEIAENYKVIKSLDEEVLNIHENNKFDLYGKNNLKSIDDKKMQEFYRYFIASLGDDFGKLNKYLLEDHRIIRAPLKGEEGLTFPATYSDSCYVILNSLHNYWTFPVLAHEFGHCYYFTYNNDKKRIYKNNAKTEIPSIFIEKLFVESLINEPFFKEYGLAYEETFNKNLVANCKLDILNCLLVQNGLVGIIRYGHKYSLDYLKEFDLEKIVNSLEDPIILSTYTPSFNYSLYGISSLISNYFLGLCKDDLKEGLKEFKEFVKTDHLYTYDTILDSYTNDLSLVEEQFKRTKEYQKIKSKH